MPSNKLVCRICGSEYEACRSANIASGAYRWQDVACCPEHGAEYLNKVLIARGLVEKKSETDANAAAIRKPKKKHDAVVAGDTNTAEYESENEYDG